MTLNRCIIKYFIINLLLLILYGIINIFVYINLLLVETTVRLMVSMAEKPAEVDLL